MGLYLVLCIIFLSVAVIFCAQAATLFLMPAQRRNGNENAMSKTITLTAEGLKKIEKELELLTTITRKEVAEKIKIARSFGDLSENSEYDEAKNEQARVEARISELESMLKNYTLIDESNIDSTKVNLGSKVRLLDKELKEEVTYTIVGKAEADPMNGTISNDSPVGKALIGKKVGQTATADTPAGELKFKILEISK